ncbi:MAG: 2-oxoglutarate/2-oxoacid ferredoxin oxidoreductase subunit alpha [Candidatus Atribacteria bacterium]|uniref:2-oxoacid:acceptor oxidoreductase subunit alpha n=1 Tax=Thermatribacter velox TaxID=3039681 RepID=A0ABZ2YG63_9BACT|nr:2-oxoglutarate/2-oxoacid ferredoxin oxidoreductase subunit alpha [Candidatus Atribacteria bacterium]MDI3530884.1 2-oxoglutarate/2-oxoacid ferredoxin oxidoreductase subunit alpha [Candidatus Atribacteria bacterium]
MEVNIKIAGEAGQGIETVSEVLSKTLLEKGWYIFSTEDYQSRIRGGHNFTQIRISNQPLKAMTQKVDILIALNEESFFLHHQELGEEGIGIGKIPDSHLNSTNFFKLDFEALAQEIGSKVFANMIAVGTLLSMLGFEPEIAFPYLEKRFAKKGPEVIIKNQQALQKGSKIGQSFHFRKNLGSIDPEEKARFILNGNQAIALGAIIAGCSFYAAYPMTPSTGIMNFLAAQSAKYGIVVEQAEDEISAINMAVGASFAGARAMTGTSGGGFCLMCEGLGLAAMTETPIVIVDAQRPGPSTGLPTRTSQGDLDFVLNASHDEFPRFVFAPSTPEEAINLTIKAFELADKYQVPTIILTDQYLADSKFTYSKIELREHPTGPYWVEAKRGYKRYLLTESGVSQRAIPGFGEETVIADSDEHDEEGHLTEDLDIRVKMHRKRMKKEPLMAKELSQPHYLPGKQATLISFGSTFGVVEEACQALRKEGLDIGHLHFSELHPLSEDTFKTLSELPDPVVIENNYRGQLANLLERKTLTPFRKRINKFNGKPFFVEELLAKIKEELS